MLKKLCLAITAAALLMGVENLIAIGGERISLKDGWLIKSTTQVKEEGKSISTGEFIPDSWYPVSLPSTVLNTLIKNGVYPDFRIGLNSFLIPDASDEFNKKHDLTKYSHLPGMNPWKDPYWYRTEFVLPENIEGKQVWLNFNGINYRADVWINGKKAADREEMVGSFSRFRLNVTDFIRTDENNYLAVKIYQVDHPGIPDAQLDVFGKVRSFHKEIMKDVTLVMSIGYDCMPTVPDRNMGIWQDVYIDFTGPVDIRNPFVVTDLPLPETNPAYLTISAELVNTTACKQKGVLKGIIIEENIKFEKNVELEPGEIKKLILSHKELSQLVFDNPRLWMPKNYGEQNLYNVCLSFEIGGEVSDEENETFGIREVTKELYKLRDAHGLRLHINGKKIFCRGGYIQPEVMYDWDSERIDTEVRYLTEANMNLVYFEDVPNPPDEFLDACDRYGLMFGNCFYGCYWMTPGSEYPSDIELLSRGTVDIIKRYRNHPSLVLYMSMNEGTTRKVVYEMWRKHIIEYDGTRFFIPSGSFPDYRKNVPDWIKQDTPVGMNDYRPKSYGWQEPAQYYKWILEEGNWMFMMESGSASLPPISSLKKFMPDLGRISGSAPYPLNETWAHHGANFYYMPYDSALRKIYGFPQSVEDYCMKGHLVTADQHRAMFEAANHRLWDITSGFTQWKINACWPSIQWQIYDWYLKPMVSFYYIKNACEPLHIQLSPVDSAVTVVNNLLESKENLKVEVRVYDFDMNLKWKQNAKIDIEANTYKRVFSIPDVPDISTPVYFVKLELKDGNGKIVSNNFYWLSTAAPADFTELRKLPPVTLNVSYEIENNGDEAFARVTVENPTDNLAFFTHLVLTKGFHGAEILPVFWEDNYFSLLPHEIKETSAAFMVKNLDGAAPALEVGGWNIQSPFECTHLNISETEVESDESFTVTAFIRNTFIDGCRIYLYIDGKAVDSRVLQVRGEESREICFTKRLSRPGVHEIKIGDLSTSIVVK